MRQVVIENPVINSPFEEPRRHFRFDDDGITDEIVSDRRPSSYFIPIAKPRKKAKDTQQTFEDWTADRIDEVTAATGELAGLKLERIRAVRFRGNSAQQMGLYGRCRLGRVVLLRR